MWELDCSTQGTRVALQRARRALQRHGGNRVLFHGYSRVLKRFPLADHMCLRSYCRHRGEISTRARTPSKFDASSSLCKKRGKRLGSGTGSLGASRKRRLRLELSFFVGLIAFVLGPHPRSVCAGAEGWATVLRWCYGG